MNDVKVLKMYAELHEGATKTAVLFQFGDEKIEGFLHNDLADQISFDEETGKPSLPNFKGNVSTRNTHIE